MLDMFWPWEALGLEETLKSLSEAGYILSEVNCRVENGQGRVAIVVRQCGVCMGRRRNFKLAVMALLRGTLFRG